MVGCWLCQCDWQQQDEQQDEQVEDTPEFTYASTTSSAEQKNGEQQLDSATCENDEENWNTTPNVCRCNRISSRQQFVQSPENRGGNIKEEEFHSRIHKTFTCNSYPCLHTNTPAVVQLTPTHEKQRHFLSDQHEEQKTTPNSTKATRPPPLLSGDREKPEWDWDRRLEKTSNSSSATSAATSINPTKTAFPSRATANNPSFSNVRKNFEISVFSPETATVKPKKEKLLFCAPVGDSDFLTAASTAVVPLLPSSSATVRGGVPGVEDYFSSEDDTLSFSSSSSSSSTSSTSSVTRQEKQSLLSKNPEHRNNCYDNYYCGSVKKSGGSCSSGGGNGITVTDRNCRGAHYQLQRSSSSSSIVGDNNNYHCNCSTVAAPSQSKSINIATTSVTGALEFIQDKVKSFQVNYFRKPNKKSTMMTIKSRGSVNNCKNTEALKGKEYYGKWIGQMTTFAHKVTGMVYAVDEDTLFIKEFTYDGLGPAMEKQTFYQYFLNILKKNAYFWTGKKGDPSPSGVIVPYPDDYTDREPPVLSSFSKEDVILHLPPGHKINNIAWLSVWCRRFTVNFGDIKIPKDLIVPTRKVLPEFKRLAHGLRSGNITILDSKTFYIPNLHYDGAGPDAFFWVGTGDVPNAGGRKIPNEKGSLDVLNGYEGEDIELKLPDHLTVYDIDWLSVWCITYKHDFGHVKIPKHDLNVPPSLDKFKIKKPVYTMSPPYPPYSVSTSRPTFYSHTKPTAKSSSQPKDGFSNCKDLLDGSVQLQWDRDGEDYIKFKLSGRIDEKQWIALGFSPVRGKTQMVGADAIVVYLTPHAREKYHADDYFMSAKSQCDGKNGVCPDKRLGGGNDVQILNGARKNGVTTVVFRRPIRASDNLDMSLEDDEINIFVAIGNLNGRNEANYHFGQRTGPDGHHNRMKHHHHHVDYHNSRRTAPNEDTRIIPKGRGDHSCLTIIDDVPADAGPQIKRWPPIIIEGVTNFTARIGPTGGKRGYTAITGNPSWGICWYLNDQLIPEIYVERGETYHFWVEGGDDSKNPSQYHPFYITDSPEGGYGQKSESERSKQTPYAGVVSDSAGYPFPKAAGRYCEWEHKTVDKSAQSESFEAYQETLALSCQDGRPALLTWTVPQDAPDTLYYQCYTHNNLGWKIHVLDKGRTRRDKITNGASTLTAHLLVFIPMSSYLISLSVIRLLLSHPSS